MRLALAVALGVALPLGAGAGAGAVDWQRKVVRCTGSGAPNLKASGANVAVARLGAERAARLDALRNCMEALKGVALESGKTVGGALGADPDLAASVKGVVSGFRQVGPPRYYSDGGVEIDVEVPLDGKLSDLLAPRGGTPAAAGGGPATATGTGLVLDARGLGIVPALAPRVLDEQGREVYGPRLAGAGEHPWSGAAYARDVESAKRDLADRLGDRPVVVKALRVVGTDAVVKDADAAALRGQEFLARGRVVIVTD